VGLWNFRVKQNWFNLEIERFNDLMIHDGVHPLNQISKSRITGIIARALVLPSSVVGADADLSILDGPDFPRPFLLGDGGSIEEIKRRTEL